MSYTVDYEGLPADEARARVLEDIETFLGTENMAKIHQVFAESMKAGDISEAAQYLGLAMCGIQGFPARVWLEEIRKSIGKAAH